MNSSAPSVVLLAHDSKTAQQISSVAQSNGAALVHFETPDAWLSTRQESLGSIDSLRRVACVVVEADLNDPDGLASVLKVCRQRTGMPVVVVASGASVPSAVAVMQAGATTVLTQPLDSDALSAALESAFEAAPSRLERLERTHLANQRLAQLTPDERAVLDALLEGKANKEIALLLDLGLRTIELRRSRIMKKTGARSLAQLVQLVCDARSNIRLL